MRIPYCQKERDWDKWISDLPGVEYTYSSKEIHDFIVELIYNGYPVQSFKIEDEICDLIPYYLDEKWHLVFIYKDAGEYVPGCLVLFHIRDFMSVNGFDLRPICESLELDENSILSMLHNRVRVECEMEGLDINSFEIRMTNDFLGLVLVR